MPILRPDIQELRAIVTTLQDLFAARVTVALQIFAGQFDGTTHDLEIDHAKNKKAVSALGKFEFMAARAVNGVAMSNFNPLSAAVPAIAGPAGPPASVHTTRQAPYKGPFPFLS